MAKRYDKRILSDALYELGKTLGRPPTPNDLTPEMARKKTYLRHFSSWEEALEYAGFVGAEFDEPTISDTSEESAVTANENKFPGETPAIDTHMQTDAVIEPDSNQDKPDTWGESKLLNLYKTKVAFSGLFSNNSIIPCVGIAKASVRRFSASAEKRLSKITGSIPVSSYYYDDILVYKQDGSCSPLPPPSVGTYLLVSYTVAKAAFRLGRPTWDLVFPDKFHWHDGTIYIESLELLYKKPKRDFSQDEPPT